jgi:hypothetical protein
MYLCHLHRYADEDTPCDECESDCPERTGPSSNSFRERTYQEALALIERNCEAVQQIGSWYRPLLWRQGQGRD